MKKQEPAWRQASVTASDSRYLTMTCAIAAGLRWDSESKPIFLRIEFAVPNYKFGQLMSHTRSLLCSLQVALLAQSSVGSYCHLESLVAVQSASSVEFWLPDLYTNLPK